MDFAPQREAGLYFRNVYLYTKMNPVHATIQMKLKKMNGWSTCDFTPFLIVFQSYQDDVWMIMKGCAQWNSIYVWEDFTSSGAHRARSARSVGQRQRLTQWATGAPKLKKGSHSIIIGGFRPKSNLSYILWLYTFAYNVTPIQWFFKR